MPRAGLTPQRLVEAAAELADREGLQAVTLSALARAVGVSGPSIYAHLTGLDDLHRRLATTALDDCADLASAAIAGRAGRDALLALANTYRDYAAASPGRYAAMRAGGEPDDGLLAAGRRHAELNEAALRGYRLDRANLVHATRLVAAVVHGFIELENSGSFAHSTPPAQASWDVALECLDAQLSQLTAQP